MAPAATKQEVNELLGEVDDLTIERIRDTGATVGEIAEAIRAVRHGQHDQIPSSQRVAEVRALVTSVRAIDDERLYESSVTSD
jgi:hypothetical protein